ncbi:hypothetical protein B0J13DRAFT_262896 [Dactylonectria estremocensis]|uniref:Uncharacterized protein n=1 Tax=Dactylonectria estremocensis TaxID=1079267 RepID=A0A9P9F3Y7_9HYPO|nr:hypothetical protein B0J13DRAFT_262896 [Dactylonectria estremocensis]
MVDFRVQQVPYVSTACPLCEYIVRVALQAAYPPLNPPGCVWPSACLIREERKVTARRLITNTSRLKIGPAMTIPSSVPAKIRSAWLSSALQVSSKPNTERRYCHHALINRMVYLATTHRGPPVQGHLTSLPPAIQPHPVTKQVTGPGNLRPRPPVDADALSSDIHSRPWVSPFRHGCERDLVRANSHAGASLLIEKPAATPCSAM